MGIKNTRRLPELRAWMRRHCRTQTELAELAEVTTPQVCRVLGGSREFSLTSAIAVSLVTDIPVEKLGIGKRAARLLKLYVARQIADARNAKQFDNVA